MDLVLSLRRDLPLSVPLLRDFAALGVEKQTSLRRSPAPPEAARPPYPEGSLRRRIERRHYRLCRTQEELARLDFKKAAPGVSPEDFVFSRIDFSRYRLIDEKQFDLLFPGGLEDFSPGFYQKNFGLRAEEIRSVIEGSYKKTGGAYRLEKESPLVLSVMRTLETSPETAPLLSPGEIEGELKNLFDFVEGRKEERGKKKPLPPGTEKLFSLLVYGLENECINHADGMTTKLFISDSGDLSGTFRPGNKPWTIVLVPAELSGPRVTPRL